MGGTREVLQQMLKRLFRLHLGTFLELGRLDLDEPLDEPSQLAK